MFGILKYLEEIGVGRREKGKFVVFADRFEWGTAKSDKGDRGVCLILSSTFLGMEFLYIVTERESLVSLRRAIDMILGEEEKREVV